MEIRAAILRQTNVKPPYALAKPLSIERIRLDPPGPGEVLVRIRVAGLCHSDLSVINGDRPRKMPIVLGHEASAEVVELGPDVQSLKQGDHVALIFVPTCGHCNPCLEGRPALCEPGAKANTEGTLLSGARRVHADNETLNHHTGVSCFAEYAVVSVNSCVRVDNDLSHREAALFGCAVLTGAGAVLNRASLKPGDTAVVVGLGGVGLSALLAAHAVGLRRLVAVDLSDDKLALAKSLGATHIINPKKFAGVEQMLEAAGGPVDCGFDMAGAVSAFEIAYALTRRGGCTITSGLPNPSSRFQLPLSQLVGEEREVKGSYLGSGIPALDIQRYINLYQAGKLPVDRLIGLDFTLDTINEGFDHMVSGSNLRDAVIFD